MDQIVKRPRGRPRKDATKSNLPAPAAPQSQKRPVGRPSLYRPEFSQKVIELGKQGKSITQMASRLGVEKISLYDWKERHPEFATAIATALTHSQDWWEEKAQAALESRNFNAILWKHCVTSRFRDDYSEKREDAPQITVVNTTSSLDIRQLDHAAREALRLALVSAGRVIEHDPNEGR